VFVTLVPEDLTVSGELKLPNALNPIAESIMSTRIAMKIKQIKHIKHLSV